MRTLLIAASVTKIWVTVYIEGIQDNSNVNGQNQYQLQHNYLYETIKSEAESSVRQTDFIVK
jgi:hypothetical protein